jgi:hypothetical protein
MIRARKEDGGSNQHNLQLQQQQPDTEPGRRPLVPLSTSVNIGSGTPKASGASGGGGGGGASLLPSSSNANVSSLVASAASAAISVSSSTLHLYNSLKQHQRRKTKSPTSSSSLPSSGIWTVQIPKRMLLSTLGVFLVFPILIFIWKETHLAKPVKDSGSLRNRDGSAHTHASNRNNPLASWVANHKPVDIASFANETVVGGSIYLPDPPRKGPKPMQQTIYTNETKMDNEEDEEIRFPDEE